MQPGTIVIANDLLGIAEEVTEKVIVVRDKSGDIHEVNRDSCLEVCNPAALALLFYKKLIGYVNVKNKD